MNVLLIIQKKTNTVVGVVEHCEGQTNEDMKGRWLATMGLTTRIADQFRVDYAPVVSQDSILRFTPIEN